jgi:glycosyltransferase involved in cell wall biosynthesis
MRIGIYDPYLDDLGGGEKYMMTIAECLSSKHEVSVFWDNEKDVQAIKERFSLDLKNIAIKKNIFSSNMNSFKRILATKNYDALIVLSDGSIPFALSKKLFLHIQQPLQNLRALSLKEKTKLKHINKIFYNSKFSQTFNKNTMLGVETQIIYPPVQLFPENVKKENIILHVGRFRVANVQNTDYKKQQVMVATFKEMVDQGLKDWKFIVATSIDDTNDEKFQEMIKSAKGYPIEFAINKTNKALWEIYNKAKIYWHASGYGEDLEKNPNYAEHFGISTVEAMGAGAVPIVINAGGQKEIIADGINGLLWDTLEELKEKTKQVIASSSEWQKISKEAKVRAKDFTKEKFCEEINKLVQGN